MGAGGYVPEGDCNRLCSGKPTVSFEMLLGTLTFDGGRRQQADLWWRTAFMDDFSQARRHRPQENAEEDRPSTRKSLMTPVEWDQPLVVPVSLGRRTIKVTRVIALSVIRWKF